MTVTTPGLTDNTEFASTNATAATVDQAEGPADWELAGAAWGHAATDWAYRFEPYARDAVDHVFHRLGVGPSVRLLDIACGSGYALGRAQRMGAITAGIDASAPLIDIARRRADQAELITGSMFDLPWDDNSFDAATSFNGIWGGCEPALAEAYRVIRPGGSLAITFWGSGRELDLRDFFIVVGTTGPGVAEEMIGLATISEPGVAESMLGNAGFVDYERGSTEAILEFADFDDAWQTLRSPGVVLPSLEHSGEDAVRTLVKDALERFRAHDGSYRLVNKLEHVIAHKPG